ncbi:uncharacterized protein LOC103700023 [Phoenix dactylifera]|uniref:Uncharacterized protein LOC103700023 n=1 Tax=Phoenix dactylifera TaxID=42345 RepID=A0A8B7BKX9_PHODC|nr:uncharacterized protein LOC103700023 [Phoenix dactylifera]
MASIMLQAGSHPRSTGKSPFGRLLRSPPAKITPVPPLGTRSVRAEGPSVHLRVRVYLIPMSREVFPATTVPASAAEGDDKLEILPPPAPLLSVRLLAQKTKSKGGKRWSMEFSVTPWAFVAPHPARRGGGPRLLGSFNCLNSCRSPPPYSRNHQMDRRLRSIWSGVYILPSLKEISSSKFYIL